MTIEESIRTTIHLTNSGVSLGLKNEFGNAVRGAGSAQRILTKVTAAATIITNENDNEFYAGAPQHIQQIQMLVLLKLVMVTLIMEI